MSKEVQSNWPYLVWFLFYFILFSVLTFGVAILFYLVSVPFAFSPFAEILWRRISGVRPLRLMSEKRRLLPLFKEVYLGAIKAEPNLSRKIRVYIQENMSVNAFSFGKRTLVLTRGSVELLSDESLKGLIAHEFGHFAHYDTVAGLFATISNLFMSVTMKWLSDVRDKYEDKERLGILQSAFKTIFDLLYYIFRGIGFIGDLILMRTSRGHEYYADQFAVKSGYAKELTSVLIEIYRMSIETPKSVKEQLRSTHPPITIRIEKLEKVIYQK